MAPLLVLDPASPTVSLVIAEQGEILAERLLPLRRSAEGLLIAVDEALEEAGVGLAELDGLVALRGPGSFTGLRVGLATMLGWHLALGLRATAISTLDVLAMAGAEAAPRRVVFAAVDALRGDWHAQAFRIVDGLPEPRGEAALRTSRELLDAARGEPEACLVGFGIDLLRGEDDADTPIERIEPPPLAAPAARLLARSKISWDPALLTEPIYFRPPAVSKPASTGR